MQSRQLLIEMDIMQKSTSELISALRLMLIMGLVLVHFGAFPGSKLDPFTGVYNAEFNLPSSLNSFFVYFFLSAVPVLSIISGYLLALNGKPKYLLSLKNRLTTVFLPSIFWTSIWLLFAFVLYRIGKNSGHFTYYDFGFSHFTIWTVLDGIFGIRFEPFAFQFWFVHDLILSILFSPIIYLVIKRVPFIYFLTVGSLWVMGWEPPLFFHLKVVIFFSFGIFLAQKNWQPPSHLPYGFLWISLFVMLIIIRIYLPNWFAGKMPYKAIYESILRANGVVAVICIAMFIRTNFPRVFHWFSSHSGYSFFIFAAHVPTVLLVKEILALLIGSDTMFKQLALWFLSPILTVGILIIAANLMSRYTNGLFRFINGQRQISAIE